MDLGSSICALAGVGAAHHFHSRNLDPDASRRILDDPITTSISRPNFHSGANGDYQEIRVIAPLHPVLMNPNAANGAVRFLPAHPHEGDVSAPMNQPAMAQEPNALPDTQRYVLNAALWLAGCAP